MWDDLLTTSFPLNPYPPAPITLTIRDDVTSLDKQRRQPTPISGDYYRYKYRLEPKSHFRGNFFALHPRSIPSVTCCASDFGLNFELNLETEKKSFSPPAHNAKSRRLRR